MSPQMLTAADTDAVSEHILQNPLNFRIPRLDEAVDADELTFGAPLGLETSQRC